MGEVILLMGYRVKMYSFPKSSRYDFRKQIRLESFTDRQDFLTLDKPNKDHTQT